MSNNTRTIVTNILLIGSIASAFSTEYALSILLIVLAVIAGKKPSEEL
jgi:hypothetical protein